MSRIAEVFKGKKRKALIGYVTSGYPSVASTLEAVRLLAASGCDIIELGIPFSDPLADGITIQKASFHALQNGVTPKTCLEIACELGRTIKIPLLFMTYYNPVFNYGLERFCRESATAGIDGLIIPDLPPEEGSDLETFAKGYNIDLVYLIAPTSTPERVKLVAERSRGFIYLVSVAGVTGVRNSLSGDLRSLISQIKKMTQTPVCIGFGISTASQAADMGSIADGVILGSRIIQLMEAGDTAQLAKFTGELRTALDNIPSG